jgi:mRNA interferase HigB
MGTLWYVSSMRVISRKHLREFWETPIGRNAEQALKVWLQEAEKASWEGPNNVKAQYSTASILKGGRVVFNINGNHYRLVVAIRYDKAILFIRFIGTHAQYDRINAQEV